MGGDGPDGKNTGLKFLLQCRYCDRYGDDQHEKRLVLFKIEVT